MSWGEVWWCSCIFEGFCPSFALCGWNDYLRGISIYTSFTKEKRENDKMIHYRTSVWHVYILYVLCYLKCWVFCERVNFNVICLQFISSISIEWTSSFSRFIILSILALFNIFKYYDSILWMEISNPWYIWVSELII